MKICSNSGWVKANLSFFNNHADHCIDISRLKREQEEKKEVREELECAMICYHHIDNFVGISRLKREREAQEEEKEAREELERARRQKLEEEREKRRKEEYARKLEEMKKRQHEEELKRHGMLFGKVFSKSDRSRDLKHRGDKSLDLSSFPTKNSIFQHSIFKHIMIPQVQIHKFLRSPSTITPISRSIF